MSGETLSHNIELRLDFWLVAGSCVFSILLCFWSAIAAVEFQTWRWRGLSKSRDKAPEPPAQKHRNT